MGHAQFASTKTDWPFSVRPLTPLLGAEISGVNLSEEMTPEVLAGIHKAMASKIVTLVTRVGLANDCAVTGGGAKDIGLVKAIEAELGTTVFVAEEPQITAAFGAAILALQ